MQGGSFSQAGFSYQNTLAAIKIMDLLDVDSDLESVELENFDKGPHIDDIIVTRTGGIEFYQVKWSEDANNSFTLHNLLYENEADKKGNLKASLWQKMVKGYSKMLTSGKPATITVYTNRKAGSSVQAAKGFSKSLTQVIAFHKKFLQADNAALADVDGYADFKPVLDKIEVESGPVGTDFEAFFRTLRFVFGAGGREELELQLDNKANFHGLQSTQVDKLLRLVVDWSINNTVITKVLLLNALGINDRFADKLSHTFKIDEGLYIENSKLFAQLDHALEIFDSGFIFIEGVPGAGKSTALTRYFARSKAIRFYYYCFLPEDHVTANLRMQGNFFLKSLCISIESAFGNTYLPMRYSDNYEEKFSAYLGALSKIDKKIIILVDGLDHVHRNQSDLELPLTKKIPATLPDNIYIIISSQYKEALPDRIKAEVTTIPGRYIQIDRFDEPKISAYSSQRGLQLNPAQIALLAEKSEGIPLYLHYIASALERAIPRQYEDVIAAFPFLENADITTYHAILFEQLQKETSALWIFALLALRREYTPLDLVHTLLGYAGRVPDPLEIAQTIKKYSHLLKERDGKYFSIFHNSFREYLLQHSTELQPVIGKALITYYQSAPFEIEAYRNYFQHLYQAGYYQDILDLVDDEWISRSWQSFKSTGAILDNLHIAWRAAVALGSIREFVRIAFLVLQVGTIHQSFEHYNFNTTISFLEAGFIQESLNTIWDGEYPLISRMDFFNRYVFWYFEKTGNLIPVSTAEPFFNRFLAEMQEPADERDQPDFENYIKAKSFYKPAESWLEEFSGLKKSVTPDQQKRVGRFLAENGKLGHLLVFYQAEAEPVVKNYLRAMLFWALAVKGAKEMTEFRDSLEFDVLEKKEKIYVVLQLLDHGFTDLAMPFVQRITIVPFIEEELIDKDDQYQLKPEFYDLFNDLKVWYLADVKNYSLFELRLSSLYGYSKTLYKAYSSAALLWASLKREVNGLDLVKEQKKIIDLMIVDKHTAANIIRHRDTPQFIKYHIQEIYRQLFDLFGEVSTDADLSQIIIYWHQKHRDGGFRSFKNDLEFASAIRNRSALKSRSLELLQNAEALAREEAGTASLVENLYQVSNGYGQSGFKEDFLRLYQDVFPLACGVHYRKDYQFSEINPIMDEMHKADPSGTLNRFADIYALLFKIKDAGDRRMMHITLSYLIKFINSYFPQLGFEIFEKDDMLLGRDEAMDIILSPLIETASEKELPYLWAILKTANKWENFGSQYDDNLKNLYKVFFEKLSIHTDPEFVESCYQYVYRQFSVEHGSGQKISIINDLLNAKGIGGNFLITPPPVPPVIQQSPSFDQPRETVKKFMIKPVKFSREVILEMSRDNFGSIYDYVSTYTSGFEINKITPEWAELYHQFAEHLGDWYKSLNPEQQRILSSNLFRFKKVYLQYKVIVAGNIKDNPQAFRTAVNDLMEQVGLVFPGTGLREYLLDHVNLRKLERHLSMKTQQYRSKLYEAISEKDILWLTENAAKEQVADWAQFVVTYFENETIVGCLINLSKVAHVWDADQAKALARQAFSYLEHNFSNNKRVIKKLMKWYFQLEPEDARHQLLKTFQSGHQEYTYEILTDLLIYIKPWAAEFNDPGFFAVYYDANYAYNQKLTEGLPDPGTDTTFIRSHQENRTFEETVTRYLLGLFNYPIVKIRELAIGALQDLFQFNAVILGRFAAEALKDQNANFKEHFVVLLRSLSVEHPQDIVNIINACGWLITEGHFNLRQTIAELILFLSQKVTGVSPELIENAKAVNRPPLVSPPEILRLNWPLPLRPLSHYQSVLLIEVEENQQSQVDFARRVNARLEEAGWTTRRLREAEIAVHQEKNNNFGPIEINGAAYQVIQETINSVMVDEIAKGYFDANGIAVLKDKFRLYDPTDHYHLRVKKPAYISLTLNNIKPADFLAFKDSEALIDQIIMRQEDWLTVFESGDEWVDGYPDHFNTYYTFSLFLADQRLTEPKINHILKSSLPYFRHENLYRSEIVSYFNRELFNGDFKDGIFPLIGASPKNFRAEKDEAIAILLPHVLSGMKLTQSGNSLDVIDAEKKPAVQLIEWQGVYKEFSSRRFQPDSKGTTLNVRSELLKNFVQDTNKNLYLHIALRRSMDRYKPEASMDWRTAEFIRKISL